MKFLLDTMTWFWLAQGPEAIAPQVFRQLEADPNRWGLSVASVWEIARKEKLSREQPFRRSGLNLGMPVGDWLKGALDAQDYALLDITASIAVEANDLPGNFHNDPMDQLIVATARLHDLTVVTSDVLIKRYNHVRVLYFKAPRLESSALRLHAD